MKRVLIIQTASIGDVILASPIIEKLHAFYPEARIDFLLKKGNESLFSSHPFLNKVFVWDKSEKKYKNLFKLIISIRKDRYDYLINIQRFTSSGLIAFFSGAKTTIGFEKNPLSKFFTKRVKHEININNKHEVDRNLVLIEEITDNKTSPVKLYPSDKNFETVLQYKTSEYICISPISLWFTKQYPAEKWVEIINEYDKDYQIYLLGSKSDYGACEKIILSTNSIKSKNLCGKLSFLESAALMKEARMNYVNDSAPQHLASAVNAPVTSIFCSTIPAFGFGPLSTNSKIVETEAQLDCRPCGLHGHEKCPEQHFKCAYSIKKEQLLFYNQI